MLKWNHARSLFLYSHGIVDSSVGVDKTSARPVAFACNANRLHLTIHLTIDSIYV